MGIIGTIICGLIIGILAKLIMPGKDPGGILITILLGIVGSFIGGWIARGLGYEATVGFSYWLFSVLGAVIILLLYRLIVGRRAAV
jgi:uncharacterized membrane protein YeaQ/YmgE (transglycosylase-associated protein family)